jgi:outer membrane protein assembly factor BamB
MVLVRAQDQKGATSQPDTVLVPVGTAGGVIWYWWVEELYITATSSPVVVMDEGKEVLVAVFDDGQIHELDPATGRALRVITLPCWALGWVAFCGQTHHLIAGDQIGDLCAVALDGTIPWQWPAQAPFWDFGAPAIRDDRIYICCDDSIRCLRDEDSICAPIGAYAPQGRVADAPVIDAQGNVYFGTDSGYLYKMGPELDTVFWRTRLLAKGEVHGPVIGGDGTIYCASDSFRLYAIDPATGIPSWTVTLDGDVFRPAIGQSAVFVGSSLGKVYSISPTGGSINWEKSLSQISGFSTTPIIAANGYVYFQDDADVLYCVNQADGTLIWSCNCPRYLPRTGGGSSHRPGRLQLTDYPPNPSICANGNIIVVGADACYCVAGYPEGPLDLSAPWPKWQKNLWNTGK